MGEEPKEELSASNQLFYGNLERANNLVWQATASLDAGDSLFHYLPTETMYKILETNSIWATRLRSQEDFSEGLYGAEIIVKLLSSKGDLTETEEKILNVSKTILGLSAEKRPPHEASPYVICASTSKDNVAQWKSFADDAAGWCMELKAGSHLAVSFETEPKNSPRFSWLYLEKIRISEWLKVLYVDISSISSDCRTAFSNMVSYLNQFKATLTQNLTEGDSTSSRVDNHYDLAVGRCVCEFIQIIKWIGFASEQEVRKLVYFPFFLDEIGAKHSLPRAHLKLTGVNGSCASMTVGTSKLPISAIWVGAKSKENIIVNSKLQRLLTDCGYAENEIKLVRSRLPLYDDSKKLVLIEQQIAKLEIEKERLNGRSVWGKTSEWLHYLERSNNST